MARTILDGDVWALAKKADTNNVVRPTSLEIADGWLTANYPNRKFENWAKLAIFEACQWIEEKGTFDWDSNITYAQYALVNYSGTIYISILASNLNQQPDTATTYWQNYYDWLVEKAGQTLIVADEASLGTGVYDGQFRGTVEGNFYSWDETDTKWNGRSGNYYASTPSFGNVQWAIGIVIHIAGGTYRYNGSTWEEIGEVSVGELNRPIFQAVASSTQLNMLGIGGYHLDGIGWVWWDGTLSYNFTTLANGVISYLYIDKSTITAPGKITNANLIDSTTAPTYNSTKGGRYNGDDRCIFAVHGLSSSSYKFFYHDGGERIQLDEPITALNNVAITATWTDLILAIPSFCSIAGLSFLHTYDTASCYAAYRNNGSSSAGFLVGRVTSSVTESIEITDVYADSSLTIEYHATASGSSLTIKINSWLLGKGM